MKRYFAAIFLLLFSFVTFGQSNPTDIKCYACDPIVLQLTPASTEHFDGILIKTQRRTTKIYHPIQMQVFSSYIFLSDLKGNSENVRYADTGMTPIEVINLVRGCRCSSNKVLVSDLIDESIYKLSMSYQGDSLKLLYDGAQISGINLIVDADVGGFIDSLVNVRADLSGEIADSIASLRLEIPQTTDELSEGSLNLYDKEVIITDSGIITVSGTYPSFNIDGTIPNHYLKQGDSLSMLVNDLGFVDSLQVAAIAPIQSVTGSLVDNSDPSNPIINGPDLNSLVSDSIHIITTGSITGGGDLSENRTISLVNDMILPGSLKYYGTDNDGTKGFFDLVTSTVSGDNWGSQVVQSDLTISGDGTIASPLKVDTSIVATQFDIEVLSNVLSSKIDSTNLAIVAFTNDYGDLDNIPSEFTPASHTHSISEINGLQDEINSKYDSSNPAGYISSIPSTYIESGDNVSELVNDSGYISDPNNQDLSYTSTTGALSISDGNSITIPIYAGNTISTPGVRGLVPDASASNDTLFLSNRGEWISIDAVIDGGDNWGSQVVQRDNTLTGNGTGGNILKVDTSIIATKGDITTLENAIDLKANTTDLGSAAFSNDYEDLDNKPTIPTVISDHSELNLDDGTNPHGTTKADVGLSNVDNTSDVNKPISAATQSALDSKLEQSDISDFETSNQLNSRDTANRNRSNHTGTQTASTISDFQAVVSANANVVANTAKISFDAASSTKLAGIEAGAQVNEIGSADIANFETTTQLNSRDAANRNRANHTGTQAVSTIIGLATVATSNDYNDLDNIPSTFLPSAHSHVISDVTGLQATLDDKYDVSNPAGYTSNSGTVTSIVAGTGLNGGNITTSGTVSVIYGSTSNTSAQGNDSRIINGQTAFGWGNHASQGYLTSIPASYLELDDDISLLNNDAGYITASSLPDLTNYIQNGDNVSELNNDSGFITGVSWGSISGTLSAQSDLQSSLNAKYDASNPSGFITGLNWNQIGGSQSTINLSGFTNNAGFITSSALSGYVQDTRSIGTTNSLTGGGNLSTNRTLQLVGDAANPGNNKYYGTNGSGTKGFYDIPSGSGEVNTGANVGSGVGVFRDKTSTSLNFKTLKAGSNITFDTTDPDEIEINATGGGGASPLTIKTETSAYTLTVADGLNTYIRVNIASANNLTIPLNSTAAIPIGSLITIEQMGIGIVTVVGAGGVTINSTARKTWGQYSVIQLIKIDTDLWNVIGGSI